MTERVPATRTEPASGDPTPPTTAIVERDATVDERASVQPRRPISVAFLPLALVGFLLLALIAAAWTFLAATG